MSETASTAAEGRSRATEQLGSGPDATARGAAILARGGLVAFPTETVYGLGADAASPKAVASLYAAKERPRFNPLIAHVTDLAAARHQGAFDDDAERLAAAFWPGPLTLVVPALPGCAVSDLARAGLDSVALRVPASRVAQDLLRAFGRPVVAPSANRSGRLSPTEAGHVLAELDGRVDVVIDGGRTPVGLESTIVGCLDGTVQLLRPGGISREAVEGVLGRALDEDESPGGAPRAPGALPSHYAPRTRVVLNVDRVRPGEAALLFGGAVQGIDNAAAALDLSPACDLAEAAQNLFGHLRRLDSAGAKTIVVAPIPAYGLGEAINDRLARAAADR